jgi:hypothetical protein
MVIGLVLSGKVAGNHGLPSKWKGLSAIFPLNQFWDKNLDQG